LCTRTQFDAQYSSPELNCREFNKRVNWASAG
jgi:hypothetical protein